MEDTFPKLLLRNHQQWGASRVALRKKEYGIWREYTWSDCYHKVRAMFLGLTTIGLGAGNGVAILGDSCPEWFWSELAVQAARGIAAGLNPSGDPEETKGLAMLSRAKFVLAQDQEQVDKLLEVKSQLPALEKIVYWREKGLRHYDDPVLISLTEVMRLGEEHERSHPGDFERKLAHGNGNDIAIMMFTLGPNDSLKIIPATHRFVISAVEAALALNPVRDKDEYVSVIPPAWFFEQALGFGACLLGGQRLNFVEKGETAPEDSREISPHCVVYPAEVWEEIAEAIQKNIGDGTRLKRTLFKRSLSLGHEKTGASEEGRQMKVQRRLLHGVADLTVLRPLRDKHGLDRARVVYAAGERLPDETTRFFHAIGVNLEQIFGSTEGGILSVDPGDTRIK